MRLGHAVVILLGRIARGAEIPDHLPRFDLGAELDARLIRVALAQMRIIIGAFPIKAADAQPPAAILIPAVGLYDPTLHSDNRRADRAEQVIAEMPPAVAVGAGIAEIVIMAVAKALRDRAIGLQPVFFYNDLLALMLLVRRLLFVFAHHAAEHRCVCPLVIIIVFIIRHQLIYGFSICQRILELLQLGGFITLPVAPVFTGKPGERINPANVRPLALFMRFYIECQRVAQSSVRCIKLYPFDVGGLRCIRLPGGRL